MIIDLTKPLSDRTEVFPGDRPFTLINERTIETDGFNTKMISMSTHAGTHADVPLHFIKNGADTAACPIGQFIGKGVLYRFNPSKSCNARKIIPEALELIGRNETRNLCESISDLKDRIVVIMTDHEDNIGNDGYFTDTPYFDASLAEMLVQAEIKAVATDLASVDPYPYIKGIQPGTAHKILLGSGIPIVEALVNLKRLSTLLQITDSITEWQLIALPLPIEGGDGCPVRACAFLSFQYADRTGNR